MLFTTTYYSEHVDEIGKILETYFFEKCFHFATHPVPLTLGPRHIYHCVMLCVFLSCLYSRDVYFSHFSISLVNNVSFV